jgi:potassium efflux system protein
VHHKAETSIQSRQFRHLALSALGQHLTARVSSFSTTSLFIFFVLFAVRIAAQNSASTQTAEGAIPLPQIAGRAEELERLLRETKRPDVDLLRAEQSIQAESEEIRQRALHTSDLLAGSPNILELRDEQRYWRSFGSQYAAKRELLTGQASRLEEQVRRLDEEKSQWQATWDLVHQTEGIEPVVDRIQHELRDIQAGRLESQKQLNYVLTLQNQVSELEGKISDLLLRVRQAQDRLDRRLLERDSRPLWQDLEPPLLEQAARADMQRSFERSYATSREFLGSHKFVLFGLVVLYLVILLGIFKFKSYAVRERGLASGSEAQQLFSIPYSMALLATLIVTTGRIASAPVGLAFVIYVLYIVPVVRLLRRLVAPPLRGVLHVLLAFCTLMAFSIAIQLAATLQRAAFTLIVSLALISLGWLTRPSMLRRLHIEGQHLQILTLGIQAGIGLLAASEIANVFGFVSLAHLLSFVALLGAFWATVLYCVTRILFLVLDVFLCANPAKPSSQSGIADADRWAQRAVIGVACLLWVSGILHLSTQYDRVVGAISKVLQYPIGPEKFRFTLGDMLTVVLILLVGYLLANLIAFLLRKVLLPRLPLQRGIPYAISTISYYLLLILVIVIAMAEAGVELNKLTVLTGAIGVGLGFGLQNIVNNFVSGLILLFERPIHLGDVVDVGGLVGSVRRIGARSSTVVTFQGAEVIVPNSNLLSNQVINWTLSSPWRRVDIPVGVTYDSDPERVLQLLVNVAQLHPGVLRERPPEAFFIGFGENALNFELRFWSAFQDTWFQLRSEVTLALAKALRESGIGIPYPQRDLHIRSVDTSVEQYMFGNGLRSAPSVDRSTPAQAPAAPIKSSLQERQ